jgi:hypothetical protein
MNPMQPRLSNTPSMQPPEPDVVGGALFQGLEKHMLIFSRGWKNGTDFYRGLEAAVKKRRRLCVL